MKEKVIYPGSTIGVLGGGQLGRMFAKAAQQMGYIVHGFTDEADSPLSQVCAKTVVGKYEDEGALKSFAKALDLVTIEFENIPAAALTTLEQTTNVRPGPNVLHVTQNRLREKTFLEKHKFPHVPFKAVSSLDELTKAIKQLGTPCVLKTAGFGYDGKGQRSIIKAAEAEAAYKSLAEEELILEQFIPFEKEISVVGARSLSGDFVALGPVENDHVNHILDISFAPSKISFALSEEAIDITRAIMESLGVTGLLCVEFFVTKEETLLVNELAPRPHNSGHLSIEACSTSQFEQLLRAVTGLPLGSTEIDRGAAMANLLGDLWQDTPPDFSSAIALPDVHLHLYGKKHARPGRKMGHLTAMSRWPEEAVSTVISARDLLTAVKA